jgi:hypothetical protein
MLIVFVISMDHKSTKTRILFLDVSAAAQQLDEFVVVVLFLFCRLSPLVVIRDVYVMCFQS